MGLRNVLKPKMPKSLSMDIMSESQIDAISVDPLVDNTVGTNPESLMIQLESDTCSPTHRYALEQIRRGNKPDSSNR